jgi:hypothetical protein
MRRILAGTGGALLLLAPLHAMAQGVPGGFSDQDLGSHIQPGKPLPSIRPFERKRFDQAVGKLFKLADTNHDGTITLAEFNAVIAGRENRVIAERFDAIDTNHDHEISQAEFTQWQHGLGSAALSSSAAKPELGGLVAEEIRYPAGYGPRDEALSRLILPLTATMLVSANTNYDAGVSLDELVAYEGKRFEAADSNKDGWLTQAEIAIYLNNGHIPAGFGAPADQGEPGQSARGEGRGEGRHERRGEGFPGGDGDGD